MAVKSTSPAVCGVHATSTEHNEPCQCYLKTGPRPWTSAAGVSSCARLAGIGSSTKAARFPGPAIYHRFTTCGRRFVRVSGSWCEDQRQFLRSTSHCCLYRPSQRPEDNFRLRDHYFTPERWLDSRSLRSYLLGGTPSLALPEPSLRTHWCTHWTCKPR